jgi:hypothetical protein
MPSPRLRPEHRGPVSPLAHALGIALTASLFLAAEPVRADPISAASAPVLADGATLQTKLQEVPQYDSNPTLALGKAIPLEGSVTTPEATINADTPALHLDADLQGVINRFSQATLNSDDGHVVGHATYKSELWQYGLTGGLDYDTTRTSEETASGVSIAGIRHVGWNAAPQVGVYLSPVDLISINGSFQNSYYTASSLYTNYRVYGASPSWQHSFDPLNSGYLIFQASRYETTSGLNRLGIDQFSPMVGWSTLIFPQWTATLNAGLQRTYWDYPFFIPGAKTQANRLAYSVDIGYKGQQDTFHLTSAQQPNPTGLGTEANTLSISLSEAHMITTRVEVDANVLWQQSDYGDTTSITQKSFLSATPKITYHATSHLDLSLAYRYRQQAFIDTNSIASSNGVLLYFTLTPDTLGFR